MYNTRMPLIDALDIILILLDQCFQPRDPEFSNGLCNLVFAKTTELYPDITPLKVQGERRPTRLFLRI